MKRLIAIYDFDGTIYKRDSFIEFFKFILKKHPGRICYFPVQLIYFILFSFKLINAGTFKEKFLIYLRGFSIEQLKSEINKFWTYEFPGNFNDEVIATINENRAKNTEIIIISASPELFIEPLKDVLHYDNLIGTQIISEGIALKLSGKNCRGPEKISRLNNKMGNSDFFITEAYSDNSDDTDLLKMARKPYRLVKNSIIPLTK